MKNYNYWLIGGIAWVAIMTIFMCNSVGEYSPAKKYDWGLPIWNIIFFGGILYVGYKAGKHKE